MSADRTHAADPPGTAAGLRLRLAARAILFDPADRVLLVHFEWPGGSLWAVPGGGIEADETEHDAALREISEETGLVHDPLVGPVWIRTAIFDRMPGYDGQREHYFTAKVDDTTLRPSMSEQELADEHLTGAAWWAISDIVASSERFAPIALGSLLEQLLADGPPEQPHQLGN